ncbi:hypothetical protein E4U15_005924 [Claviceps sp. LM218 group G6]|nr:hypothetical protein E4U15_005924 [Claviceps sp. LM218 group G6]
MNPEDRDDISSLKTEDRDENLGQLNDIPDGSNALASTCELTSPNAVVSSLRHLIHWRAPEPAAPEH